MTISRLRKLLLEQPLPNWKVAAEAGVNPTTLSRYALGREVIKSHHLVKLCNYFDLPPEKVLGYVEEDDIVDWAEDIQDLSRLREEA